MMPENIPLEEQPITCVKILQQDICYTIPFISAFVYKPKFSIAQDILQCVASFSGATAVMWYESGSMQSAFMMSVIMILGMATSKIAFNLLYRITTLIYSYTYSIEQQIICKDIIKHDILTAIPILNSCFKANFSVDQNLMLCAVSIAGGIGSMAIYSGNLQDSIYMASAVLPAISASRSALNLCYRGVSASRAMIYSYLQKRNSSIQGISDVEMQFLHSHSAITFETESHILNPKSNI